MFEYLNFSEIHLNSFCFRVSSSTDHTSTDRFRTLSLLKNNLLGSSVLVYNKLAMLMELKMVGFTDACQLIDVARVFKIEKERVPQFHLLIMQDSHGITPQLIGYWWIGHTLF